MEEALEEFWRKKPSPDVLTEGISGRVSPSAALVPPEGCKIQARQLNTMRKATSSHVERPSSPQARGTSVPVLGSKSSQSSQTLIAIYAASQSSLPYLGGACKTHSSRTPLQLSSLAGQTRFL